MKWLVEPLRADTDGSPRQREHDAAYGLLCRLTGGRPTLEHDTEGAPYLPEHPELHVSLSHCRTAVAAAVSTEGKVGIDIECRRRIGDGLMERVCTADELAAVHAADDPVMAFLRLWTRKEAVLKCRGTGIKGFGSMVDALAAGDCEVTDLDTGMPDVVAAVAVATGV